MAHCKQHPAYQPLRPPESQCWGCWRIWNWVVRKNLSRPKPVKRPDYNLQIGGYQYANRLTQ